MNDPSTTLSQVISLLAPRIGEKQAITIAELCKSVGCGRRKMETILELHLGDMGFYVVSTGAGYFRPTNAEEVNHAIASLRSRELCLFLRHRKTIQGAKAAGYIRQGRKFLDPPPKSEPASDLFEYAKRRTA